SSLSRDGYVARWMPSTGSEIFLMLAAVNEQINDGVVVICRIRDTGTFTVPASTFALIPRSLDRAVLIVARIAETEQTVDDARITIDVLSSVNSGPLVLVPVSRDPGPPPATDRSGGCDASPLRFFSLAISFAGMSRVGDVPPVIGGGFRL